MSRRTLAVVGVSAFVVIDLVLVLLALRGVGQGVPAEGATPVTVTQTVWTTSGAAGGSPVQETGRSV